ncbi:MAG: hypothetical protein N3A38_07735 [Planctomycetota bacterium]|nr:hypothetical protein [Planctomycetota bacterium]
MKKEQPVSSKPLGISDLVSMRIVLPADYDPIAEKAARLFGRLLSKGFDIRIPVVKRKSRGSGGTPGTGGGVQAPGKHPASASSGTDAPCAKRNDGAAGAGERGFLRIAFHLEKLHGTGSGVTNVRGGPGAMGKSAENRREKGRKKRNGGKK